MHNANSLKWNAVALWAWDIVVDNCAICRNHIMDLCQPKNPILMAIAFLTLLQVSNVKQIKVPPPPKNALLHGESAM